MKPITVENKEDRFIITIDKASIDEDVLMRIVDNVRLEQLAKEVDFGEDIEALGKEIKAKWWQENKDRLLGNA